MFISGLILVVYATLCRVEGGGSSCQDIDHDACVSMGKQNSQMCADPVLSNNACPAYCSNCPVTCYNCNTTHADVQQCNTVTCNNGEICSAVGKRSIGPDISIHCCGHDLCNAPATKTTTTLKTTKTTTTPSTTTTTTTQLTTDSITTRTSTLRTTTVPLCIRDVIFMVDDTVPMALSFSSIKAGILDIIDHLQIGQMKTRVALGTFNTEAWTHWQLNSFYDKARLQNSVRNLVPSGMTSYVALNQAAVELVLGGFRGDRPSVQNVVVLVTGRQYQIPDIGLPEVFAIQQLHRNYHNVIVIAVQGVYAIEARSIATDSKHFFSINSPNDLNQKQLTTKVAQLICQ